MSRFCQDTANDCAAYCFGSDPSVGRDDDCCLRLAVAHHRLGIPEAELVLLAVTDLDSDARDSDNVDARCRGEDTGVALLAVRDPPNLVRRVLDVVTAVAAPTVASRPWIMLS